MITPSRAIACALGAAVFCSGALSAQTQIPLNAESWTATDSIRFVTYNGKPSLYINRGIALAKGVSVRDGVIEYDMATPRGGNFMGLVFHASSAENSEVVYFRPASSGQNDAMQYAPALNGVAAAWQVYHRDGGLAPIELAFDTWTHVKIDISGSSARVFVNSDSASALDIPRLAGVDGAGVGVWTGFFGRGAYYTNIRYTSRAEAAPSPKPVLPRGTITEWELSNDIDASTQTQGVLPDMATLKWQKVHVEDEGYVLVNRYRKAPNSGIPTTREGPRVDSIVGGRVSRSKVVYARATINADVASTRRMWFGYSDGATIYVNGRPVFYGINPSGLRCCETGRSSFDLVGDAVYVPLVKGKNEIVFAVTEFTGGWAYWGRIDP